MDLFASVCVGDETYRVTVYRQGDPDVVVLSLTDFFEWMRGQAWTVLNKDPVPRVTVERLVPDRGHVVYDLRLVCDSEYTEIEIGNGQYWDRTGAKVTVHPARHAHVTVGGDDRDFLLALMLVLEDSGLVFRRTGARLLRCCNPLVFKVVALVFSPPYTGHV